MTFVIFCDPGDSGYIIGTTMTTLGAPIAAGRTAEIYPWEDGCILKLTRAEFPARLADQEWQKAEAAWKMGAPAPRPVKLIEIDGRRGVVFQRISGQNMVQAILRAPWRIDHYARLLGRLHADLHRLSAPGFPSYHERVHWRLGLPNLLSERQKTTVLRLLERLPDEATLCHADFHPENILLAEGGPLVIDWEGSLRGEPGADVAQTCLWIRSALMAGSGPRGWLPRQFGRRMEWVYLSSYQLARGPVSHLREWLAIHAACSMQAENLPKLRLYEQIASKGIPGW